MRPVHSIRTKVTTIVLAGVVGALCVSILATSFVFDREYAEGLQANAIIVARNLKQQLERMLRLGIHLNELEGFDEQCREAIETHADLAYAMVVDTSGEIVFSNANLELGDRHFLKSEVLSGISAEKASLHESADGEHSLAVVGVGQWSQEQTGYVVVAVARERVRAQTRELVISALAIGFLLVAGAIAWTLVMLDAVLVHPLGHLLNAVRRLADSPTNTNVGVDKLQNDEIGIIGKAFNDMLVALRRTHGELQDDIAKRRDAERKLARLAHYDELTGLPNRAYFLSNIEGRISDARRHSRRIAVLFLDLDRFKFVNDTFGHAAGDELLVQIARRLREHKRAEDLVARMGGDEFVVVVEELETPQLAGDIASKLITVLAEPISVSGHEVVATVSVGISLFPEDGDDLSTVMKNADAAMYRAKAAGKNSYQFYSDDMRVAGLQRVRRETEMRHAVLNRELELRYQPIVTVDSGQVVGVEALLRWRHPVLGLLEPSQFLTIAEESGLILPMGHWALNQACIDGANLRAICDLPLRLAVNVSGTQLREHQFPELVTLALSDSGFAAQYLELEITEHTLLKDLGSVRKTLLTLNEEDVRFSIDDFGTGYSSLMHLKHLPVARLKIDQSFVRDIAGDPDDRAIVTAVVALADNLGLGVVAEGVETRAQLEFLRLQGCAEVQGYLCGQPMPFERLSAVLAGHMKPGPAYQQDGGD